MGIGKIWRRLIAKMVIVVTGSQATQACGNYHLCAGLSSGLEGAVHAMQQEWDAHNPPDEIATHRPEMMTLKELQSPHQISPLRRSRLRSRLMKWKVLTVHLQKSQWI